MRPFILAFVIFAFSVPVYAASYVSVLKCGGEQDRFELFLDKEDLSNALYSYKAPELRSIQEVQSRRLHVMGEKGNETTRIAISYSKAEESLIYNDITKRIDLKIAGQIASLDCRLSATGEHEFTLYKLHKL